MITAHGQEGAYRLQSDPFTGAGLSIETWKAGDDNITLFSVPVTFVYPQSDKLLLYAITAPALSSMNTGESYSLTGLSDIKWGGHYLAFGDRFLFTFGMNLPTGKSALDAEEYSVASVLSMPAFGFRVPTLGQGLDFQGGVSTARTFGEFILGAGLSYMVKGAFEPFKGSESSYDPGDEITLTAGADRNMFIFNRDFKLTGDIMYTLYFDDTWSGEKVFRSGNRLVVQLMSAFKVRSMDVVFLLRNRSKAKNRTGTGDLYETEKKNRNMNQFELNGILSIPYSDRLRLRGILDLKKYSDNDYGTGGASLFGFGGGARFRLSPAMDVDADLRYYTGSVKSGSENTDATGFKLYGGIVYTL